MSVVILISVYAWKLHLQKNDLARENRQMTMYIRQNIDGEK